MRKPTHSFRGAALGVVAAAVGIVAVALAGTGPALAHAPSAQAHPRGEAQAAVPLRTPGHLVPRELPPHPSSDWYASDVTKG
ncbi:hypothetical protein JBE27_54770, partial [Streptomyces albiflaviniger]|nr:hypothetical protein [Streptomyces albiflaviniger]